MSNEPNLLGLAEAVADGGNVDWDRAESSTEDPEERRAIHRLRMLAAVGQAARALASTWGPLDIRSEIGSGTFGTVYRAWDRRLEREVALKLLHEGGLDPSNSAVIKEGRLLARIRHHNVVTVHGADAFDGRVGIWMEFVTGRTLKDIVRDQGPFGAHEAAVIGRDLCRALAAVHKAGFLHRDIKAQNVMREAGGRIVLMDFGAGDALQPGAEAPGALRGTPAYLAPDVLAGAAPSVQSDVYSLGVLLYFLVSGEFPVAGSSLDHFRELHAAGKRRSLRDARPDLPAAFVRVVDAATAANPGDRPESAGTMEAMLDGTLARRDDREKPGGPESDEVRPSHRRARLSPARLGIAAIVLAIVTAVAWLQFRTPGRSAVLAPRNSVAVLPFRNVSPDGNNDYFSDGIAQDIVAHLMTLPGLRVIHGASVQRYRDRTKGVTEIGNELNVAAVLDGSVLRTGERVNIVVQLLDAASGEPLWSDTFERRLEDVFALQSEVSHKVAVALRGELSEAEVRRVGAARGRDYQAFTLYLRGRQQWARRTEEGLQASVQFYQQAIARDPSYALAFAGLADSYTSLGTYGYLPREDAYARAAAAAEKAVSLDDTLAEAHISLAYAQKNRFEWAAADESFRRGIDLKPGYVTGHHYYSIYLTQVGRFPQAVTEIRAALALDPDSVGANLQAASLSLMMRRYQDAISQSQRVLQNEPNVANAYRRLTVAYTYLGLYDRAMEAAAEAAKRVPLGTEDQELKSDLGYVLAVSGRRDDAMRIVREFTERYEKTGERLAGSIAAIYAALGDREAAFVWLTRARDARDPEVGYLKVDPRWDPLRSDERFGAILASLGLGDSPQKE